jgi:hypothetical protein
MTVSPFSKEGMEIAAQMSHYKWCGVRVTLQRPLTSNREWEGLAWLG